MKITVKNFGRMISTVSLIIFVLCYINAVKVYAGSTSPPTTLTFTVDPSLGTDQPLYEHYVGETFNVTIMVHNVTDLYTWQVEMFYNASVIKCVNAFYPTDHVFAGKTIVPVDPVIDNENNGSVLFGCSLMGSAPRFNGTGKLCTFTFNGTEIGISTLHFSQPYGEDTFLMNYDLELIPAELTDGTANIIPELSTITAVVILLTTLTATVLFRKRWRR